MRIVTVSEAQFKDLWSTIDPDDRNLCDLTCRHFFNYRENVLFLVKEDIVIAEYKLSPVIKKIKEAQEKLKNEPS